MNPAQRHATYEDLLQVPDQLVAEIIDGELLTTPRPAFPHARVAMIISRALDPFDSGIGSPDGPGGWWMLFEPELHLGADIVVPDIASWRRERIPVVENIPIYRLKHSKLTSAAGGSNKYSNITEAFYWRST
jgi:hypothetical protein